MKVLTAVDVATTGKISDFHELIGIKCCMFNIVDWKVISEFSLKVRPICPSRIDPEALEINGLHEWEGFPKRAVAKGIFINWLQSINYLAYPISHDWSFDRPFLERFLGQETFALYFGEPPNPHCTKSMMNALMLAGKVKTFYPSLENCCDHFDIPHDPKNSEGDLSSTLLLFKKILEIIKE